MGIFSGIKDFVAPGIGAGLGALLALPTGGLSVGVGAAIGGGLGFNIAGASAQADALEKAGKVQEASALRAQIREQQFFEETAEFRQLAREQIPGLRAEAESEPGTSPLFKRGLERGLTQLKSQFSGMGLGKSSTLGFAAGEFASNLTSDDIQRLQNLKLGLAGGATTGLSQTLGAGQLGQGAAGNLSNLLTSQGAAKGGALGDTGNLLTMLPLLFGAGGFGKTGSTTTGGTLGSSIGKNQLEFGTQFNQFQPPTFKF